MFDDLVMSFRCWLLGRALFLNQHLLDYRVHQSNTTALSRQLSQLPVAERRTIEELEPVSAGRKIDALRCFATDLCHARDKGLVADLDWALLHQRIRQNIKRLEVRVSWWSCSLIGRFWCFFLAALTGNPGFPMAWAIPRLLPLELYVRLRPIGGNLKRWIVQVIASRR